MSETPGDAIDSVAGAAPGSAAAALRAQRPEVAGYAQGSFAALLEPEDLGGVGRAERELVALRVATLAGAAELAAWHRDRLASLGAAEGDVAAAEGRGRAASPRLAAILRHAERVTSRPAGSTRADLGELTAAGLSPRDIVTVAQLIGFLSFQLRALAGLRLLTEES